SGGPRMPWADAETQPSADRHAHVVETPALVARRRSLFGFAFVQPARERHERRLRRVREREREVIRRVAEPESVAERVDCRGARLRRAAGGWIALQAEIGRRPVRAVDVRDGLGGGAGGNGTGQIAGPRVAGERTIPGTPCRLAR